MSKKTLVFILGNLTAFGPFVTDFYLPCQPELTTCFAASASVIQVSLTAGMLGLAAGQLLIGPVTDKYGRKRPLLWCLLLFVVATVGCILSTSIVPFIGFRLLQGLTGASGLVISKVIIADSFSAADLTKYFALLAAVQGAAPNLMQVFASAALMAYISASPFIFQQHFGLTPMEYGLCFAGNAVGLVTDSAVVMRIKNLQAAARWSALGLLTMAVLMSVALLCQWPFGVFEVALPQRNGLRLIGCRTVHVGRSCSTADRYW